MSKKEGNLFYILKYFPYIIIYLLNIKDLRNLAVFSP